MNMTSNSNPKGLADVVVSDTHITSIDGLTGKLYYRGYEISDLAHNSSFEETSYLLFYGELPSSSQLNQYSNLVYSNRPISENIVSLI